MAGLIVGAAVGNCVHVAGVINFLRLAEEHGYQTKFLGPAVSVNYLLDAVEESAPVIVAVGYRLTPETGYNIFKRLKEGISERGLTGYRYVFGGTLPVARKAEEVGFFDAIFSGEEELDEIIAYLEGRELDTGKIRYGEDLIERYEFKQPYPLIRHHFGLPTIEETINGIRAIAESKVLDIISLGPDQNAQKSFFRPEEMDEEEKGAGGVPIRSEGDLNNLYQASRRGNYPLMRSYSGTRDVFKMAEMLVKTIKNAWSAVPLSWYNQLDGRGPRGLLPAIRENQNLMKWHGERDLPLEVNEAHHWSLRDAHDTVAVVMAFLAAYNAKKMGVKTYLAQYMFNTPNATSAVMDIAKMLAKKELISGLVDYNFRVLTQVRAGLTSFPTNLDRAKGQLAYSTWLGMNLKPDIVHVVGYSEANHAAASSDVIASCHIARQVINNSLYGLPDPAADPIIRQRQQELLAEAGVLLAALKKLAEPRVVDPWSDPETIARAIKTGIIDAPHLKGNPAAAGKLTTKMVNGACYAYDYQEDRIISENERLARLSGRQKT
ncbi:MAG: cobalamin B12-binding domain-containing protein [Halanaerobiales bacterium]|nr:cobalamin B12-binding domain-containing protein [Halanaerobiales bacterium]